MSVDNQTTIAALSTPQGPGAIGVIRVSGKDAIGIVDSVFVPHSVSGKPGRGLKDTPAYRLRYGSIYNGDKLLDDVIAAVFRGPRSYTGEDSVEIYCHGSNYIIREILMLLISKGVKMAGPGEFSKRAFLNGKLDLAQAEAVADLIASETSTAHQVAMQQMKGGFSRELKQMRDSLLNLVSLMELELDFSEEEVEFANRETLNGLLYEVESQVDSLIESFTLGNVIKNGIPVTIAGATNTGKSTLLNTLLGEEKAIVSNIHGTTRDIIEDTINIGGMMFRFIDTAGIRDTQEMIEIMGIERTYLKLKQASVVMMVLDATRPEYFRESLTNLRNRLNKNKQKVIILINKADMIEPAFGSISTTVDVSDIASYKQSKPLRDQIETIEKLWAEMDGGNGYGLEAGRDSSGGKTGSVEGPGEGSGETVQTGMKNMSLPTENGNRIIDVLSDRDPVGKESDSSIRNRPKGNQAPTGNAENAKNKDSAGNTSTLIAVLPVSAKHKLGIKQLKELLVNSQKEISVHPDATLVTNIRHYEALIGAQAALDRVEDGLKENLPTDLVAQDIREALYHLGSIVGEINTEEILETIFGRFCIGK